MKKLGPRTRRGRNSADRLAQIEQYKLLVQSADNNSGRRIASNRYLMALNTAIAGAYVVQLSTSGPAWWLLFVSGAGVMIAYLWKRYIESFKKLNRAKFEIIHRMEEDLPWQPFKDEWEPLERDKYEGATSLEILMAIMTGTAHAAAGFSIFTILMIDLLG